MTFVIFRNKETKEIKKYSLIKSELAEIEKNIFSYNESSKELIAEIVNNQDLISLIEIAEENKKVKNSCLKDIEQSIEMLRSDFYDLQSRTQNENR